MTDAIDLDNSPPADPYQSREVRVNGKFAPGHRPAVHRPKGSRNKINLDIKKETVAGLAMHGSDGKGKDGYRGWVFWLAKNHPESAAMLAAKMMPRDYTAQVDVGVTTINILSVPTGHVVDNDDPSRFVPMDPEPILGLLPPVEDLEKEEDEEDATFANVKRLDPWKERP